MVALESLQISLERRAACIDDFGFHSFGLFSFLSIVFSSPKMEMKQGAVIVPNSYMYVSMRHHELCARL